MKTYSVCGAKDQSHYDALLTKGWFPSYEEAVAGKVADNNIAIDDISAPTREELEQKAIELGIGFNKRTSDQKLAERIAAALEG